MFSPAADSVPGFRVSDLERRFYMSWFEFRASYHFFLNDLTQVPVCFFVGRSAGKNSVCSRQRTLANPPIILISQRISMI
jgi:hypothetical protein